MVAIGMDARKARGVAAIRSKAAFEAVHRVAPSLIAPVPLTLATKRDLGARVLISPSDPVQKGESDNLAWFTRESCVIDIELNRSGSGNLNRGISGIAA